MKLTNKYAATYFRLIQKAKVEGRGGVVERHHIVPRSLGGTDDSENIVALTPREHFVCHLLLTKMCEGEDLRKMQFALACMTMGMGRYAPRGRIFEMVKTARVNAQLGKRASVETKLKMSQTRKGKPQPDSVKSSLRELRTGVPLSEEHRQAVSKGLSGTTRGAYSESHKEAIRVGNLGKVRGPMSDEHKRKIAASNSKPKSEETKRKMKLAWEIRRQKEASCV